MSALLAIYPECLAVATAIGDAVFNGAQACAPYFGALLYEAGGFKAAFITTGTIYLFSTLPSMLVPNLAFGGDQDTVTNEKVKYEKYRKMSKDLGGLHGTEIQWSKIIGLRQLFPMWHSITSHILFSFYMPLLSMHAKETLQADVVWSGKALMLDAGVHCIAYPIVGLLVDRYRPWKMMIASAIALPMVYICLGPIPLPFLVPITPGKTQLLITLACLGLSVPMATIPSLPAMFHIYRSDHEGELPKWAANTLISLYCASFAIGWVLGTCASGFIAPYASFAWSTGSLGLIYIVQSTACVIFCVNEMKRSWMEEYDEGKKIIDKSVNRYGTTRLLK
jgi:hypothetical protein